MISGFAMGKNIVICCDGTGNEVEGNLSNVLKLFRMAQKNDHQCVYYSPGIGTIGSDDSWTRLKQNGKAVFELATGYGLDGEIADSYRFICESFEDEDSIYLFGFSRGAYTVRVLAGFIHMVGLLRRDQLNIANYALTAYKRSSQANDFSVAWNFSRVIGGRRATIKFLEFGILLHRSWCPGPIDCYRRSKLYRTRAQTKASKFFATQWQSTRGVGCFGSTGGSSRNRSWPIDSTRQPWRPSKMLGRYGSPAPIATSAAAILSCRAACRSFLLRG